MTKQIKGKSFDAVFCSDLKRAVDSAKLTFGKSVSIIQDKRLRECNYGDLTQHSSKEVEQYDCIHKKYPNGESYPDVENRVRDFIKETLKKYAGKHIAIVAHKAPQLALEVIINNKTWEEAVKEDWRLKNPKEWKPGWEYVLKTEKALKTPFFYIILFFNALAI